VAPCRSTAPSRADTTQRQADAPSPHASRSPTDSRRGIGRVGEELACWHLERQGYRILERNYRTRFGELDIIAFDGRTLVFCEVKARLARTEGGTLRAGTPLEAVHSRKRAQVRRIASRWLMQRQGRPRAPALRFDAIGVTFDTEGRLVALEHVEAAF